MPSRPTRFPGVEVLVADDGDEPVRATVASELYATALEALLYGAAWPRLGPACALGVSAVANAASLGVGLVVGRVLGQLAWERARPRAVEMHVARTLAALECANRAEAVHKAPALGLID